MTKAQDIVGARNALDPTVQNAFTAMGLFHDEQRWEKVVELGDAWYAARGGMMPTAATWYAQALQGVGRYGDAVGWAQQAAQRMPKDEPVARIAAWSTYSQALARVGHFSRAKTAMATAISIAADHAETSEKQGHMLACLATTNRKPVTVQGKWVPAEQCWGKAWEMMEARLVKEEHKLAPGFRSWDGKTKEPVSVLHEQGLGDAVLSARWLKRLAEKTEYPVTYYGPSILRGWMAEIPGVVIGDFDAADERGQNGGDNGAAVRSMSLAYHQHMRAPSDLPLPWCPPSIKALRLARPRNGTLRVGVCWKGAKVGWHDFERSFTAEQFQAVWAPLDGVQFVNMAHETDMEGLGKANFADVMDSARTLATLDLLVSVDTGVVHMAGSIGVPTLVLPPTVPDWRYEWPTGESTPFYSSVTVVRRKRADDLSVIALARRLVESYVAKLKAL